MVSYRRGPYAKRQGVERIKSAPSLEHYEIEHCIMFDPNEHKYYVKLLDYDAIVFSEKITTQTLCLKRWVMQRHFGNI